MRHSNGLLGLLGIILLLFAGIGAAVTRLGTGVDVLYVLLHAAAGVFALVSFLSSGMESLRAFLGERSTKYGTSTIAASLFFFFILASVNYLSTRYHHRFDLTESGVFSLSPQSVEVVKALDGDLRLQAFVEGGVNPPLRDLLDSYRYASAKVAYEMIDPDRHPELAEKYQVTNYNTVRVEYGDGSTSVSQPTEETITNAIIKVSRRTQQTVCFIDGHGEPPSEGADEDPRGLSRARAALANENYQTRSVLLPSVEAIPGDCSIVVVAGPEKPFQPREIAALDQYLRGGKRAIFLLPPRRGAEFQPVLANWGVTLGDDVVVDQVVRLFQGPALGLEPLVNVYDKSHEITRDFKERTVFPMTRSVLAASPPKRGVHVTELAKTSASSWAETDLDGLFDRREATLDGTDRKGPVPVAVAVAAKLKDIGVENDGEARLAVFGSVEFAANRNFEGSFYNGDLFLNTVGWMVGQSDLVSIRPRSIRASRVRFTQDEGTVIFYLSVLVIPELLLVAGIVVWWRRE